jgi:uncharacterized protein
MTDTAMTWQQLVDFSTTHDLLAMQMYVLFSEPTNGLQPVLDNLDEHIKYQTKLEQDGIMFGAGPFASTDEQNWDGAGMFIYRAANRDAAARLADSDPMHIAGARSYTMRRWMLNEGTLSVRLRFSAGKPVIT